MKHLKLILATIFFPALFACGQKNNPSTKPTVPVENITATKDQLERRIKSEAYCKAHNIPTYSNPNALFVDAEEQVALRTQNEVVDRALALFYIGLKSEGLDQKSLNEIDKKYAISTKLTANEKVYATAKKLTDQQEIDGGWRYESLHVMLWALGYIDSLSYPEQMCNVANDVKIIHDLTEQQFRQKAKLRSKKEILDQADLILRIDWACVDARVKKQPMPGNLNKGVVFERHHSLNWLIRYMQQYWDNVSTDT